jgi:hypothetical protein
LLTKVPVNSTADHFRAQASNTQAVLTYLVRQGSGMGTYAIPVSANGSSLVVGSADFIATQSSGAEFDWFPAAGQWALTYRTHTGGYARCWQVP